MRWRRKRRPSLATGAPFTTQTTTPTVPENAMAIAFDAHHQAALLGDVIRRGLHEWTRLQLTAAEASGCTREEAGDMLRAQLGALLTAVGDGVDEFAQQVTGGVQ